MIINSIHKFIREIRLSLKRQYSIKNKKTIICNNCLGGILSHDYRLQFASPFVNLWIPTKEYIELLNKIDDIKEFNLIDISYSEYKYPIGLLNEKWTLHFQHYKTFIEAEHKWTERIKRMNFSDLYVILVETYSCTYEDLLSFDKLPFKNKIALVHRPYPEIKSAFYIKGYNGKGENGEILWPSHFWGTCLYDQVNWTRFLNLK